jgi:hypothetical protein
VYLCSWGLTSVPLAETELFTIYKNELALQVGTYVWARTLWDKSSISKGYNMPLLYNRVSQSPKSSPGSLTKKTSSL